ncbi:MAG: hypothetical protein KJO13_01210 [Gammaproteobacteria bacterium]|nr:hypothetical protein [Gammaproteobacteria bacterium]
MSDFSNKSIVELAAIVANHLKRREIRVVLVGGLAVEIYSENIYLTNDIDMIDVSYQKPADLHKAMAEIGFAKQGRVFVNETTDITVEFPSPPITVGDEAVTETTVAHSPAGEIPILKAADVIKDRLAAYFHWKDKPSLVQALAVLIKFPEELPGIESFCRNEGSPETIALVRQMLAVATEQKITSMAGFEKLVVELSLQEL